MPPRDKTMTTKDAERWQRRLGAALDSEKGRMTYWEENSRQIEELRAERTEALAALKVIALDPRIAVFLATNDPKALAQVQAAIDLIEGAPQAEEVST